MAGEVLIQMGLRARCLVCNHGCDFSDKAQHPDYDEGMTAMRAWLVTHFIEWHRLDESEAQELVALWVS